MERVQPPLYVERPFEHNFWTQVAYILRAGVLSLRTVTMGTTKTQRAMRMADFGQHVEHALVDGKDVRAIEGSYGYPTFFPLVEHWDGTSWTLVRVPIRKGYFNQLSSVAVASSTDVWAAGLYSGSDYPVESPLVEHWDGNRWSQVRPVMVAQSSSFASVAVVSPEDVWTVGSYDPVGGGAEQPFTEHSKGCGGGPGA